MGAQRSGVMGVSRPEEEVWGLHPGCLDPKEVTPSFAVLSGQLQL